MSKGVGDGGSKTRSIASVVVLLVLVISMVSVGFSTTAAAAEVSISSVDIQDPSLTGTEQVSVRVTGTVNDNLCYDHELVLYEKNPDNLFEGETEEARISFEPDGSSFDRTFQFEVPNDETGEEQEYQVKLVESYGCSWGSTSTRSNTYNEYVSAPESEDPDPQMVDTDDQQGADAYIYYYADDPADAGYYDITNPPTIHPGETVDINYYVENNGGAAGEYSAVQIQFPQLTDQGDDSQFSVSASGFPENLHTIAPGDTVYDQTDPPQEAMSWQFEKSLDFLYSGSQAGFTAEVTPEETGEFPVLLRSTLSDDTEQNSQGDFVTTYGTRLDPDQPDYQMREVVFEVVARNEPPIADAGGPYSVDEGESVPLDASGSSDPDGHIDETSWSVTSGSGYVSGGTYYAPDSVSSDETATVELTVTDDDGDTDTDTATVDVNAVNEPPNADAGGPYSTEEGGSVSLDSSGSSDPDGSISSRSWSVVSGPGSVSGSTYNAPNDITNDATATVELTVTDNEGEPDTDTATVDVTAVNQKPTADAGGPYSVDEDGSVALDASGSSDPDGSISSTSWSVISGPGSVSGGTYDAPASVSSDTTATVEVTVTDNEGAPATDTATVTVNHVNDPPVADAGGSYSTVEGGSVSLDSSGSYDPDGHIDTTDWTVSSGPGSVSGGTYYAPDSVSSDTTATVTLDVTDDDGSSDSDSATIQIAASNDPPTADAGGPYAVDEGGSVSLDASGSSDSDGSISSTAWSITSGPGSISGGTYDAPDAMSSDATVTVQLTVTDDDGEPDTDTATVDVTEVNDDPSADAGGPYSVSVGETVALDASGSTDEDGTVQGTTWAVTSGPGSIVDGTYHAPADGGSATATVRVTVTDDDGATDADTATVDVRTTTSEPPTANVTYSPKQPVVGEWVEFDASGSVDTNGTIDHYQWEIDGNRTPTSTNPLIGANFSEPGTYHVMVIVTDDDGLTDTASVNVTVEGVAAPTANATATPSTVNVSEPVTLDASASTAPDGAIVAYDWDLDGDGAAETTGETTTVSFSTTGTQEVTLEVTDDNGNNASTTLEVRVVDPNQAGVPVADAGADLNATAGGEVSLDGSGSYHTGGESITYEWTQVAGPSVTLSANGSATPTFTAPSVDQETSMAFDLTVSDASGNTSTDAVSVVVAPADDGGGGDGGGSSGGGDDGSSGGGGGWVPTESDVQVTVDSTPTDPVTVGESFVIDATLENRGDADAQQTIQFGIDGTVVDFTTREIASGETAEVSFEYVVSSAAATDLNVTVRSADDVAAVDVAVSSEDGGTDGDGTSGGSDDGGDSSDGGDGDSTGTEGTAGEDGSAQGGSGAEAPAEDTSGGDGGSQQRVADGGDSDGSGDGGLPGFGIAVGLGVLLTAGVAAVRYWG